MCNHQYTAGANERTARLRDGNRWEGAMTATREGSDRRDSPIGQLRLVLVESIALSQAVILVWI